MRKIIFQGSGFGDFWVCFKALYAIKQLYPKDKLIVHHSGIERAFMQKVGFIDELLDLNEVSLEQIRAMEPDIFIASGRNGKFFKKLEQLKFKKIVVQPHFISFTHRTFTTPFPYFRGKMYMAEVNLKLVRAIDPKHYDANIDKIDFSKIKDFLPRDETLVSSFFQSVNFPYKKVIGINAFSGNSESRGTNFFLKGWLNLAFELGKTYPEFLFVLLNFKQNPIQFQLKSQNVRTFTNSDSIASLTSMSLSLDYLISVDTGNVHLCKLLQVPSLIFIDTIAGYRYGGGGCEFIDSLVVKAGWQKNYQKTLQDFTQMAKERLDKLK